MGRSGTKYTNPPVQSRWGNFGFSMALILVKVVNHPDMGEILKALQRMLWVVKGIVVEINNTLNLCGNTRLARNSPLLGEGCLNRANWRKFNLRRFSSQIRWNGIILHNVSAILTFEIIQNFPNRFNFLLLRVIQCCDLFPMNLRNPFVNCIY